MRNEEGVTNDFANTFLNKCSYSFKLVSPSGKAQLHTYTVMECY